MKVRNIEQMMVTVEELVEKLWSARDTEKDPPRIRNFREAGVSGDVELLLKFFNTDKPMLGVIITCACLDEHDLHEINERLYVVEQKLVGFDKFFHLGEVEEISDAVHLFYEVFVSWAHKRLVPPGKKMKELTDAQQYAVMLLDDLQVQATISGMKDFVAP